MLCRPCEQYDCTEITLLGQTFISVHGKGFLTLSCTERLAETAARVGEPEPPMTRDPTTTTGIARRQLLRSIGLLGLGATLAGPVRADEGRRFPLDSVPVYFTVYAGVGDDPGTFRYPDSPGEFRGFDPAGALFDASELVKSANGKTIYYDFHFTPDNSIVGPVRPYVLVHEQDGRYTSRGQEATFDVSTVPEQFPFLQPGTWRAVGRDVVKLDRKGGELDWAITRVDFYRVDGETQTYQLSLLYLIWREGFGASVTDPQNPQADIPSAVDEAARELVAAGVAAEPTPLSDREAIHVADEFEFYSSSSSD